MKDQWIFLSLTIITILFLVYSQNSMFITGYQIGQINPGTDITSPATQTPPAISQPSPQEPSWAKLDKEVFSCVISGNEERKECGVGKIAQTTSDPSLLRQAQEDKAIRNILLQARADSHCLSSPAPGWESKVSILPKLEDYYEDGVLLSLPLEKYNTLVEEINCN